MPSPIYINPETVFELCPLLFSFKWSTPFTQSLKVYQLCETTMVRQGLGSVATTRVEEDMDHHHNLQKDQYGDLVFTNVYKPWSHSKRKSNSTFIFLLLWESFES
ncbi:uncharacterized protein DS421_19g674740 [Arachis hypogaea]|uniref:Uncharacterized protein n=1 Tax=Arachis hypogaea TaxID=3818 RepID=A0A6B9VFV3_ARAHY|nr:uncharacterized protein DS421_19g674740 [Arachis hypogaea]